MDSTILESKAYEFVGMLEVKPLPESAPPPPAGTRVGEGLVIELGEVEAYKSIKQDPYGEIVALYHATENGMVGMPENKYMQFKDFIVSIQELPGFVNKTVHSFLEEHAFDWLVEIYTTKKARQGLITYLLDKAAEQNKEYIFYFRLQPLILEKTFTIGNAEITFLDDAFLKEEEEKFLLSGKTETDFDGFMNQFTNCALIKVRASGVEDRAKKFAMQEAELAAAVLKCFLYEYSIYGQYKIPDVDHRVNKREASPYIYHYPSDKSTFSIVLMNKGDLVPVEITETLLKKFTEKGLPLFSDFIKTGSNTDLYFATINAIRFFSEITSTINKYEKIVKLVSLFEAVLIDQRTKTGGGETLLVKRLIPKLALSDADKKMAAELAHGFYRIRDAYVHHGQELTVDFQKLSQFQTVAFLFISFLIRQNKTCNDLSSFYQNLNQ